MALMLTAARVLRRHPWPRALVPPNGVHCETDACPGERFNLHIRETLKIRHGLKQIRSPRLPKRFRPFPVMARSTTWQR